MAEILSDLDGQLLSRLDAYAAVLGASRSQVVVRALQHYLDHADDLKLKATSSETGPEVKVDWAQAKRTFVASHCPYPDCPHNGNCPIEICPL